MPFNDIITYLFRKRKVVMTPTKIPNKIQIKKILKKPTSFPSFSHDLEIKF